jgi:hypothetical protein
MIDQNESKIDYKVSVTENQIGWALVGEINRIAVKYAKRWRK